MLYMIRSYPIAFLTSFVALSLLIATLICTQWMYIVSMMSTEGSIKVAVNLWHVTIDKTGNTGFAKGFGHWHSSTVEQFCTQVYRPSLCMGELSADKTAYCDGMDSFCGADLQAARILAIGALVSVTGIVSLLLFGNRAKSKIILPFAAIWSFVAICAIAASSVLWLGSMEIFGDIPVKYFDYFGGSNGMVLKAYATSTCGVYKDSCWTISYGIPMLIGTGIVLFVGIPLYGVAASKEKLNRIECAEAQLPLLQKK